MSVRRPVNGATVRIDERFGAMRDSLLLSLVLCTLVQSGEALAGDAGAAADPGAKPDEFNTHTAPAASLLTDPKSAAREFAASAPFSVHEFSSTEFRPHPQAALDSETSLGGGLAMDEHLMGNTTVWQQLEQFRSQDRVRLLTLWQARASSVSLQADKHGGPSLQWSSPWMLRGRSSNGLLDRLLNVPPRGIASRIGGSRPAAAPLSVKPAETAAERPASLSR
jgi:hypothetical protein